MRPEMAAMFEPQSYAGALACMVVTMLCWGSWANARKLTPGFRFPLFYWDYVSGLLTATVLLGLTLGSLGSHGRALTADLAQAGAGQLALAAASGAVFNVANLLLVAAIEVAGLAVAFPVGIGLALVVGAVSSYGIAPAGNAAWLFTGVGLVVAAIVCDAAAYAMRERGGVEHTQPAARQAARKTAKQTRIPARTRAGQAKRGLGLSVTAGLLMGTFYPLVARAMQGEHAAGPYSAAIFFAMGAALCALPANGMLMRWPIDGGKPTTMRAYGDAPMRWHIWGAAGGAMWAVGATLNFVAAAAGRVGPAVSYAMGQGATMVTAAWGVFVWREFRGAPPAARWLLAAMFVLFVAGLTLVALAPLH